MVRIGGLGLDVIISSGGSTVRLVIGGCIPLLLGNGFGVALEHVASLELLIPLELSPERTNSITFEMVLSVLEFTTTRSGVDPSLFTEESHDGLRSGVVHVEHVGSLDDAQTLVVG